MASSLDKRLQRIEELLQDRLDTPVAFIWLKEGEDPEAIGDEMIASGKISAADRSRVRFGRWLTEAEYTENKPHYDWQHGMAGPPDDGKKLSQNSESSDHAEAGATPSARDPTPEQEARYKEAVERRARELVQERLDAGAAAFAKSIV